MLITWILMAAMVWLLWNICKNTGESLDKQTALQYEIVALEKRLEEMSKALAAAQEGGAKPVKKPEADAAIKPVSINKASIKELSGLPKIGKAMAEKIVAGRPYEKVEDLSRVQGVSDAMMAELSGRIEL